MNNIRLLPIVVLAVAALLVLKTVGLVTNGGYVLGVGAAQASGGDTAATTPQGEPTLEDTAPTLADPAPTMGETPASDAAQAGQDVTATEPVAPAALPAIAAAVHCVEADASLTAGGEVIRNAPAEAGGHGEAAQTEVVVPEGSFALPTPADCLPSGDVVPMQLTPSGQTVPVMGVDGLPSSEQQLLERLTARRAELEQYEQDLAMRAAIVDAAEKRIEERAATLAALEAQISTLVDQRTEMETGQFAGIVAMYEAMKPKDAARIFNELEMDVLLRVAKAMSARKMAPILAEMTPVRAQDLTVQMAGLADRPPTEMTPDDLAALPQIIGQ